jgi:hypothetical protein
MNLPINVKSPNNISKWQMGFNSAFKGLKKLSRDSEWERPRRICCHWHNGKVKMLVKVNTFCGYSLELSVSGWVPQV